MAADMLLLAERLVVAMERMSHDVNCISLLMSSMGQEVKNVSAYVFDLNHTVSRLLNERSEKEIVSKVPCEDTSETGQDTSAETEFSLQCKQADGSSGPYVDDVEDENISVGVVATISIDHNENLDVSSSVSNPSFTEGIKKENEENDNMYDVRNMSDHGGNNSGNSLQTSNDIKSETQFESQRQDMSYSVDNPHDQLSISSRELNQQPHFQCSGASYSLQIPSSVEAFETTIQGRLWKSPSEDETLPFQKLHSHELSAVAYCSAAGNTMGKHSDSCSLQEQREVMVAGERQRQHVGRCESEGICLEMQTRTSAPLENRGGTFESSLCKKQQTSKGRLICSQCGKYFMYRSDLSAHLLTHANAKLFKCTLCSKAFNTKGALSIHMRFHSSVRPFKCSCCEKAFFQRGDLTKHLRIHVDERPFKCHLCGKSFRTNFHLNRHMLIHSGEKPFRCAQCGKEFNQSCHLSMHKLTHTK